MALAHQQVLADRGALPFLGLYQPLAAVVAGAVPAQSLLRLAALAAVEALKQTEPELLELAEKEMLAAAVLIRALHGVLAVAAVKVALALTATRHLAAAVALLFPPAFLAHLLAMPVVAVVERTQVFLLVARDREAAATAVTVLPLRKTGLLILAAVAAAWALTRLKTQARGRAETVALASSLFAIQTHSLRQYQQQALRLTPLPAAIAFTAGLVPAASHSEVSYGALRTTG